MREIKFRAWDTESKMWLKITAFETKETKPSAGYTLDGIFHDGDYVGKDGIILMQYTGLKDKNGKEIYEGDIVKANLRFFDIVDQKCRVIFHNGSFGLQYGYSLDYFKPLATWDDIEVIGNIYEHPHLLKGDGNDA